MDTLDIIFQVSQKYGRYPPSAYIFVFETLEYANKSGRGLTGRQLCLAAFNFSLNRYGALARAVWETMNIHSSEDIGRLVYDLVDCGLIGQQEGDNISDFNGVLTTKDFDNVTMTFVEDSLSCDFGLRFDPPEGLQLH